MAHKRTPQNYVQIIDPQRLADIRTERGITVDELASRLGVGVPFIRGIELGASQIGITGQHLHDLVRVLAVPLSALLPGGGHENYDESDAPVRTIALIAAEPEGFTPDAVALALGIGPDDLLDHVESARHRLRPLGLTIAGSSGRLRVGPLAPEVAIIATARAQDTRRALNRSQALALHRVIQGRASGTGNTLSVTVAYRSLARNGTIEFDSDGNPNLTDRSRRCLGIDQPIEG